MKIYFYFIPVILILLIACSNPAKTETTSETASQKSVSTAPDALASKMNKLTALFTKADAEKILGEPATVTDSTMSTQSNIISYKSAYTGKSTSDKTGVVYFVIEDFSREPDAITKYGFIKASNENRPGWKVLDGVGDEGYMHGDGNIFYFTMIRKGTKVISLKVNKTTPTTSLESFNQIARRIADSL